MAKLWIILHGKAAARPDVRSAIADLRERHHEVQVRVTWEAGDTQRLTREGIMEAGTGRIDRIVAGGGDGTVNEVFSTALQTGLPDGCSLGIMPLGTANDFARTLGLLPDDMGAALALIASAPPSRIDVGVVDGRPFINMLSGGFGSRVTAETDPVLKQRLGGLAYIFTGARRFHEMTASRGRFVAPDFSWEGPFVAMAIGNGRQAGGGLPLCPDALLDDGLLDLMILPELDAGKRLDVLASLLQHGARSIEEHIIRTQATWIEYQADSELDINLDGEPLRKSSFRVECVPQALPVHIAPQGSAPML